MLRMVNALSALTDRLEAQRDSLHRQVWDNFTR